MVFYTLLIPLSRTPSGNALVRVYFSLFRDARRGTRVVSGRGAGRGYRHFVSYRTGV
jgi:hypothetical protein